MVEGSETPRFVFVYGTLMKGFEEGWQAKVGARLMGTGRIRARLYDLGEYPGAVPSDSNPDDYIVGELYELRAPERAFQLLDQYEEYSPAEADNSLFIRKIAPVRLDDGRRETAWVYFYNRPLRRARLIPTGDYREKVPGRA